MKIKDLGVIAKETVGPMAKASLVCLGGAALLGIALSLGKCPNEYSHYYSTFRGYPTEAGIDPTGRKVILYDKTGQGFVGGTDVDKDGVFDKIYTDNLPEDHPLRAYENPDSLEVAYSELTGR